MLYPIVDTQLSEKKLEEKIDKETLKTQIDKWKEEETKKH